MRALILLAACFASASCAAPAQQPAITQEGAAADMIADGRAVAQTLCASCHALDSELKSPRPDAPPFSRLEETYKLPVLEEELIEGIKLGHPDMPQFQLPPRGVDALLAYLRSIQKKPPQP